LRYTTALLLLLAAARAPADQQLALDVSLNDARAVALGDPERGRAGNLQVAYATRYLDCTHFFPTADPRFVGPPAPGVPTPQQVLDTITYFLNHLSWKKFPAPVRPLADGRVLAINLDEYGIDKFVYKKLEQEDPYYHVLLDVQPVDPQGKPVGKPVRQPDPRVPWLDPAKVEELQKLVQSSTPILRADWFFAYAGIQRKRVVGYYDLAGLGSIKTDKELLAYLGVNEKISEDRAAVLAASVGLSGVTLNNRAMDQVNGSFGAVYRTIDFDDSRDRRNTTRLTREFLDPRRGDASEWYFFGPNGLMKFALFDKDGKRQDVAPNFIAGDRHGCRNDYQVHVGVSCLRCHVEGLRPIHDWRRNVYRVPAEKFFARPRVEARSPLTEKTLRDRDVYFSNLDRQLNLDRERYRLAAFDCNGLSLAENAENVGLLYNWYDGAAVTSQMVAQELGLTHADFMAKLKLYADDRVGDALIDPVVATYLADPPEPLPRLHVEEAWPQLQKIVGNERYGPNAPLPPQALPPPPPEKKGP
jgi:hypothetical protein